MTMTNTRTFFTVLALLCGFGLLAADARADTGAEQALRKDVETLSSEAFEGRGVGTAGLERACEYLENRFEEAGLRPFGDDGYRQAFDGPNGTTLVNLIGVLGKPDGGRHVIVGAHYDHLGLGEPGDANEGKLHPGADDNASGVAALLECARRLAGEGELEHAVVFVAFSGEEKGLLGSAYYVDHAVVPLTDCTAMINLDTVGRLFDGPLTVFGANTGVGLSHVLQGVNYGFKFELELPEKDVGGSDQTSFVRRGVPAVQIFTGPHADYHRPSDTADKIDYEGLDRVAGFTTELLIYLADRDELLSFVPPGAEKAAAPPGAGGRGRRVSFGSIPDFNYSGEGVRVSGVIPGSPAEKAGLEAGDVLVEFAGVAVDDLRSFSDILKGLSPGEEVDVVFLRDGERHTATTTVVERK
jgi:aminopeptidase N